MIICSPRLVIYRGLLNPYTKSILLCANFRDKVIFTRFRPVSLGGGANSFNFLHEEQFVKYHFPKRFEADTLLKRKGGPPADVMSFV